MQNSADLLRTPVPKWAHLGWFKRAKVSSYLETFMCCMWCQFWVPKWGPKIGTFGIIFEVIFWNTFWSPFGPLLGSVLGSIWAPDRPKKGARCAQEGHQELQRPKKLHFQKPQKTFSIFRFLGSRGLPREPRGAQEGSQEAPKELQKLQKKGSKNRPQKSQVWERF